MKFRKLAMFTEFVILVIYHSHEMSYLLHDTDSSTDKKVLIVFHRYKDSNSDDNFMYQM